MQSAVVADPFFVESNVFTTVEWFLYRLNVTGLPIPCFSLICVWSDYLNKVAFQIPPSFR